MSETSVRQRAVRSPPCRARRGPRTGARAYGHGGRSRIDIEPPGSVPPLLALRGTAASPDAIVTAALKKGGVDAADHRGRHQAACAGAPGRSPRKVKGAAGRELARHRRLDRPDRAHPSGFTPQRAREVFLEISVNNRKSCRGALPCDPTARKRIDSLTFRALRRPGPAHPAAGLVVDGPRVRRATATLSRSPGACSTRHSRSRCPKARRRAHDGVPVPVRLRRLLWSSPMAHSLAMDALTRGFALTGDEPPPRRRRCSSRRALAASDVAVGAPVWFPIYPFDPGLRVS